jgi:hypothetical protein
MTQLVLSGSRKLVSTASFEGELPRFLAFYKTSEFKYGRDGSTEVHQCGCVYPIWKQPFLTSQISLFAVHL